MRFISFLWLCPCFLSGLFAQPYVPSKDTIVVYQAEAATTITGASVAQKWKGYSGNGYVSLGISGNWIEWKKIEVPETAIYNVVFRYSNGEATMNPCKITINGDSLLVDAPAQGGNYGKQALPRGTFSFCTTTANDQWMDLTIQMRMLKGTNKLRITVNNANGGPNIDKITVQKMPVNMDKDGNAASIGWQNIPAILKRINSPRIAPKSFFVNQFGAINDGIEDCKKAINATINACSEAGGGMVIIPAGKYKVCGTILLKSKVAICLKKNAYLQFSGQKEDYLPNHLTTTEGNLCYKSSLIYAFGDTDIAIIGEDSTSVIDGGQSVLNWKDGKVHHYADIQLAPEKRPLPEARPSVIDLLKCKNVLLENYKVVNSPFWTNVVTQCTNVTLRGVVVRSLHRNNDGMDIQSCKDVLIEHCNIESGDDAICIKAGRDRDGALLGSCEDVVIKNNTLVTTCANLGLGSEMSGGIRNIYVDSNGVNGLVLVKSNYDRGGFVRDVFIRQCQQVERIQFHFDNYNYRGFYYLPEYRNFYFEKLPNLQQVNILGRPENHIKNVQFHQCGNPTGKRDFVDNLLIED